MPSGGTNGVAASMRRAVIQVFGYIAEPTRTPRPKRPHTPWISSCYMDVGISTRRARSLYYRGSGSNSMDSRRAVGESDIVRWEEVPGGGGGEEEAEEEEAH